MPSEATTAATIRSINPALDDAKAHAYARSVIADAGRTGLDPKLIMGIVTVESRWRATARSGVGAQGLGQLMPGTAAQLGVDPKNPADNLRGTSKYLESLLHHFAGKPNALTLAIAGYNAGPGAVARFHGIPPYPETQHYVRKVLVAMNTIDERLASGVSVPDATRVGVQPSPQPSASPAGAPQAAPAAPAVPDVAKSTLASVFLWPLRLFPAFAPNFLN